MSLEGRLRDLGLQELCQLLTLSRKSGTLHIHAQLEGRAAAVVFQHGAIVDAWQTNQVDGSDRSDRQDSIDAIPSGKRDARAVEATFFALLTWRDGAFRFAQNDAGAPSANTGVRLGTEALLVEATRRADGWSELADRIAGPDVVPAFVDAEPRQLPLLHLVPQEWEVLTRVDGQRDLPTLALALGRDVLDVARIVHGLIGTGLLTLRDVAMSTRAQPTPPAMVAVTALDSGERAASHSTAEPSSPDLWIPGAVHVALTESEADEDQDDMIFDPISVGVLTPEGLPRLRTPLHARSMPRYDVEGNANGNANGNAHINAHGEARGNAHSNTHGTTHGNADAGALTTSARLRGDAAARRGDLADALVQWSAYLHHNEQAEDASHVREAMDLATRLHALLHIAAQR